MVVADRAVGHRLGVELAAGLCVLGLVTAGVTWGRSGGPAALPGTPAATGAVDAPPVADGGSSVGSGGGPHGTVTLAFAGDMHFQLQLAALLGHPRGALGPMTRSLAGADLTMVNLESAIAREGRTRDTKELEVPDQRYYYRTSPAALDVLADAGVDVVTMANNHGADYGPGGLSDTLAAIRQGPVAVVGVGRDRRAAFTPYEVSVRGTEFAFLGADASMREGASSVWAAGPHTPGLAAAHADRPRALLAAVRAADRRADVVVVYLHWGRELRACPTHQQRVTAHALAAAGADVVVGSHTHVLLGSGWLGDTYVDYGLGNFLWYHDHHPVTGVLRLTVRDGRVVGDGFTPARIQLFGHPRPVRGAGRAAAVAAWRGLRGCTDLAPRRSALPAYTWSVHRVGPSLRERMRSSHHPGCPVPLRDLRYLRMAYVGFDGRAHRGEMVVHRDYVRPVARVFRSLYDARWPVRRMRLVDDYGGSDARSMAADNTSGFNCRRVAGSTRWSDHAFGAAIDVDPVRNPDLSGAVTAPRAGWRYANLARTPGAPVPPGVITAGSVVVRAFARIGWEWGGSWTSGPDYQHFSAPVRPVRSRRRP